MTTVDPDSGTSGQMDPLADVLAVLEAVSSALAGAPAAEAGWSAALEQLAGRLGFQAAILWEAAPDGLHPQAALALGQQAAGLLSRRLDAPQAPAAEHTSWGPLDERASLVGTPVTLAGRRIGTIELLGEGPPRPDARVAAALAGAAVLLAPGLAAGEEGRLRRAEATVTEAAERIVSQAAARLSTRGLDTEAILGEVAAAAGEALGASRASCYVFDADGQRVATVVSTESDPGRRALLQSFVGNPPAMMPLWHETAEQDEPLVVVEDLTDYEQVPAELARRLGMGSLMAIRLEHPSVRAEGAMTLLGTIFASFERPRRFDAHERTILRGLGSLATLTLANARLHAEMRASLRAAELRAEQDPLTDLLNHRAFRERLTEEAAESRRSGTGLSLAVFDVDRLREINDAHGHRFGDQALVAVAGRLSELARASDTIARIGGGGFAWIMPGCAGSDALALADSVRIAVAAVPVTGVGAVTLSGGVAEHDGRSDAEGLLRLADGALYWAKQGRDRVVLYSPEEVEVMSAEERVARLERSHGLAALRGLARAVDAKDPSTRRHSARVAETASRIAAELGWPAERVARLQEAGLMHDVGKIGVPDEILKAPRRLTVAEYEIVKEHAVLGAQIVADILDRDQVAWVRGHHERHDGRGYPDGLAADQVPEGARILAVADAWDVMVSVRPYAGPMPVADALAECRRMGGVQFDPEAVNALCALVESGRLRPGDEAPSSAAPAPAT